MLTIPAEMVAVLAPFAPVFFQERVWLTAQTLLWGTILAQGPRTVASALRAVGLALDPHFATSHRVLNRSRWSAFAAARVLLGLIVSAFVPASGVIVVAIDDFIERRPSKRLLGRGAYRDPVASSRTHLVTCFGLRWLVASVCIVMPGAERVWALPFLSLLCQPPAVPTRKSSRSKKAKRGTRTAKASEGKAPDPPPKRVRPKRSALQGERLSTTKRPLPGQPRHKSTIDRAAQVQSVLSRWLPEREVVMVVDGAFFCYKLLRHAIQVGVKLVTRGRWEMVLYEEPEPRPASAKGPAPSRGARQGTLRERLLDPATEWKKQEVAWYGGRRKVLEVATGTGRWSHERQLAMPVRWVMTRDPNPDPKQRAKAEVFVTTAIEASAEQIIEWYVMRWSEEVTFEESRRHLGIESQRQWSRLALARETPVLLGLFSIVTLLAHTLSQGEAVTGQDLALVPEPTPEQASRDQEPTPQQAEPGPAPSPAPEPRSAGEPGSQPPAHPGPAPEQASATQVPSQQAAWYPKQTVTFSDCLALVRRQLWRERFLQAVASHTGGGVIPAPMLDALLDALPMTV